MMSSSLHMSNEASDKEYVMTGTVVNHERAYSEGIQTFRINKVV